VISSPAIAHPHAPQRAATSFNHHKVLNNYPCLILANPLTMRKISSMHPKRRPQVPSNPGVFGLVQNKRAWLPKLKPDDLKSGFRGWHERGYSPHRDEPNLVQFVTFRLADSFPHSLRSEWEAILEIEDDANRRRRLEAYLDRGHGECHLRRPEIAQMVEASLRFRNGPHYELRAWVIMPNHVHLLFQVLEIPMSKLVDAWKGFTAKEANRILGRHGQFWLEDYWDTFMRDADHERRTRNYIEANPVKAALVATRQDWPWSSTRFRDNDGRLCLPD
jgi:REP element-mobilizing transposase RayT